MLASMVLCALHAAHADSLVDPTQPVTARAIARAVANKEPAVLHVEAIFSESRSAQRRAIVDGKVVHEGDYLGAALIEHIGADHVRYARNGRTQIALISPDKLQVRKAVPIQLAAREEQP